ncbi:hypothetical protein [Gloeothece verrucosa]|uniref:Uncharacterized protein n=1 Tax=Gloeothece verrucosa (strain PCC 7822) TaxID=497965 RepID=E0UGL0_GLOV7|nr:hypothetical protein [Gloeothece verrucosa]ADN13219.1 conserved hypothetical protein [Gloeothece verrucosa PCC 7822]
MSEVKYNAPITLSTLMVIGVSVITFTSIGSIASSRAQALSSPQPLAKTSNNLILPAGTQIPVKYDQSEKILLTKEDTMALTLKVATNITYADGTIIIPNGSEIVGEIKPSGKGSQFFSQKIFIKSPNQTHLQTSLDAISQIITKIETLIKGVDTEQILKGATLGNKAENLIASFKNYNRHRRRTVNSSELEALAGWFLSSETLELISINPEKDLNLTLRSELVLK